MIIYLLQHKNISKYTKIGITSDMNTRVRTLQTGSPTGIEVLYQNTFANAKQIEKNLNERYMSKYSNNKWFKLSNEDIWDIINFLEETKRTNN